MSELKRIIMHWTGGPHKATDLDREHYHFIVEGDGKVVSGKLRPEDNISTNDGIYGAHTLSLNTGSIGVSIAAMAGAHDVPFSWGSAPITETQVAALCKLVKSLCDKYGIEISRRTVLTHAEVQPTLKIKQRGKWDICCLPGDKMIRDPVKIGDILRARIVAS
jgi:N-acetyl-anhydromuramyl-L-alanine amidase AmpD